MKLFRKPKPLRQVIQTQLGVLETQLAYYESFAKPDFMIQDADNKTGTKNIEDLRGKRRKAQENMLTQAKNLFQEKISCLVSNSSECQNYE